MNLPVLFRSYASYETHTGCKIWQAARATSAAPTFFKQIQIGRSQPFVDGGMGCNNPSKVLLEEANSLFKSCSIGCLLSIGTGQATVTAIRTPGFFQQIIPTDVINALNQITTDCETIHEAMLGHFANLPNIYFRFNVEHGMQEIRLSDWEELGSVEAHTTQYLKKKEISNKLNLVVNAICAPKAFIQPTAEQISF